MIDWEQARPSPEDFELISEIATRAAQTLGRPKMDCIMDLEVVHHNNPLRLRELLGADDFNFNHDILGIARHLNRETGELEGFFVPRFSAPTKEVSRA